MIKIAISVDGDKVADGLDKHDLTLNECAVALYRLEEIKQALLDLEFDEMRFEKE